MDNVHKINSSLRDSYSERLTDKDIYFSSGGYKLWRLCFFVRNQNSIYLRKQSRADQRNYGKEGFEPRRVSSSKLSRRKKLTVGCFDTGWDNKKEYPAPKSILWSVTSTSLPKNAHHPNLYNEVSLALPNLDKPKDKSSSIKTTIHMYSGILFFFFFFFFLWIWLVAHGLDQNLRSINLSDIL